MYIFFTTRPCVEQNAGSSEKEPDRILDSHLFGLSVLADWRTPQIACWNRSGSDFLLFLLTVVFFKRRCSAQPQ